MVWSKSYGSSAIPFIGMLLLVALILLGLTAWVVSGILECNALCEEYPWYCRRDSWSCEVRYPNYIRVDYVFPVFLGFFALIFVLGVAKILFSDISYVEVSGRGFLIVRGYLRRRETLISKEEIQELTAPRLEGRGFCTLWGFHHCSEPLTGAASLAQAPPPAPGRCGLIAC